MPTEQVNIQRIDYRILPFRRAKVRNIVPEAQKPIFEEAIGRLRVLNRLNGDIEVDANLLLGVVVRSSAGIKEKVDTWIPEATTSGRIYYLRPGDLITLERPRLLRGKTILKISHIGEYEPKQEPPSKNKLLDTKHVMERRMALEPQE